MYRIIAIGLVVVCFTLLSTTALPVAAEPVANELEALLEQGKPEQAYERIGEAVQANAELQESHAFLMAAGRVCAAYSKLDPPINAGEGYRVRLQAEAVECFTMAQQAAEPGSEQRRAASSARQRANDTMGRAAVMAFEAKRFDLALEYTRAIMRVSPEDRLGPVLTVRIGQSTGRDDLQLEGARAAVAARLPIPDYYSFAATLEANAKTGGGLGAALAHIETGLAVAPDDLKLLAERVRYLILTERGADATAALERFRAQTFAQIEQPARRVPYLFFLGLYSEQLGQPDAAKGHYQAIIDQDPKHLEANAGLGRLLIDEAAALRRQEIDLPLSEAEQSRQLKAQAAALLCRARAHFEAIHDPQAPNSDVMVTLIQIYGQLEDFDALRDMQAQFDRYRKERRF